MLVWFIVFCLLLIIAYTWWAFIVWRGWKSFVLFSQSSKEVSSYQHFFSVIIPFRNEESRLPILLKSLESLNYQQKNFEIIFSNDHGTDAGLELVKKWIESHPHVSTQMISTKGSGKKNAQLEAVTLAKHNYLVFTDADCVVQPNWLVAISQSISASNADLLFGPIILMGQSRWQALEFASIIGSTMAMLQQGWPVMGNGANMVVRKSSYLEAQKAIQGSGLASGDDVFLLHTIHKKGGLVIPIAKREGEVHTQELSSLKEFIRQRLRWAAKASRYQSKYALVVAWLVFLINAVQIFLVALAFFFPYVIWVLVLVWITKWAADYFLLVKFCKRWNIHFSPHLFFLLEMINPIYITGIAVLSQIVKFRWKDRRYSS